MLRHKILQLYQINILKQTLRTPFTTENIVIESYVNIKMQMIL